MKRILALTAAAVIAAAPFAAMAADTAAPAAAPAATTPAPAAADAAAPVEHTLKDGTKISVASDMVSVVGADGTKTPAPDGEWELEDGTKIKTVGGKIAPADAAPAPASSAPAGK